MAPVGKMSKGRIDGWVTSSRTPCGNDSMALVAAALNRLDDHALRERFAPAEMMKLEIYPEIWDRDPAASRRDPAEDRRATAAQ